MSGDIILPHLYAFRARIKIALPFILYRGADKSLAHPTYRRKLFDAKNISFDPSLVLYIYIYIYIVLIFLQL
jgi:hypothetical protein